MADIVVQAVGSPVEEKFYVATDRNGAIQTWYCGSIQSSARLVAYDQIASDEYKIAHGELASRVSSVDDAELVIKENVKCGRTRFEVRRLFRSPLGLVQLDAQNLPLGRFMVYLIDELNQRNAPELFMLYLDSVRLRGVAGASTQFKKLWPTRDGKRRLAAFEQYLSSCIAPWWDTRRLDSSVKNSLEKTPSWNVFRRLL
ncbi:MAG: hypothetical protein JWR22_3129 [Herminiimonas sp.]|nr:hypothetical protein [Herminiimonas sp.]